MAFPVLPAVAALVGAVGTVVTVEVVEGARRRREDDAAELTASVVAGLLQPPTITVDQARVVISKAGLFPTHAKAKPIPTDDTQGIVTWGDGTQPLAAWRPSYLHSRGCKDLRWGVCIPDLLDTLREDPNSPQWGDELQKVITTIANVLAAGSGKVSEWLLDRLCLRYKWPLYSYITPEVGLAQLAESPFPYSQATVWSVVRGSSGVLQRIAPPHPFPHVPDWKRVWVSSVAPQMTRNENSRTVMWAIEDSPDNDAIAEVVATAEIRGMLRMSYNYTGAITAGHLANAECGKSKWWPARRDKAMAEYT